jgi:hypothetical protein
MAKLDRPLYGENATGTLARALAFRRTENPPDLPGITAVYEGTVTALPRSSCPPSPAQALQRARYAATVACWNALTDEERASYAASRPANLTGFNFFIRLALSPDLAYLGYCIFGLAWFQLGTTPHQPAAADYDMLFPNAPDEFPTLANGADAPQAWLLNRAYDATLSIQGFLIAHRSQIEGG